MHAASTSASTSKLVSRGGPTGAYAMRVSAAQMCRTHIAAAALRSSSAPGSSATCCAGQRLGGGGNLRGNLGVTSRSASALHATGGSGSSSNREPDFYEVRVDSVRVSAGASVVFLRLVDRPELVLPVHIGEAESSALLREINKQKGPRPITHDLAKNLLLATGCSVTKIRITELVNSTYYSRIHMRVPGSETEVDVDARPSDAVNLAVRFGAPMYIHARIACNATPYPAPTPPPAEASAVVLSNAVTSTLSTPPPTRETHAEITRSVRDALSRFEDPTRMLELHKEMAVREERYSDAQALQRRIFAEMSASPKLRLVVAMEAALADGRFDEAARARDEYKRLLLAPANTASEPAGGSPATTTTYGLNPF